MGSSSWRRGSSSSSRIHPPASWLSRRAVAAASIRARLVCTGTTAGSERLICARRLRQRRSQRPSPGRSQSRKMSSGADPSRPEGTFSQLAEGSWKGRRDPLQLRPDPPSESGKPNDAMSGMNSNWIRMTTAKYGRRKLKETSVLMPPIDESQHAEAADPQMEFGRFVSDSNGERQSTSRTKASSTAEGRRGRGRRDWVTSGWRDEGSSNPQRSRRGRQHLHRTRLGSRAQPLGRTGWHPHPMSSQHSDGRMRSEALGRIGTGGCSSYMPPTGQSLRLYATVGPPTRRRACPFHIRCNA